MFFCFWARHWDIIWLTPANRMLLSDLAWVYRRDLFRAICMTVTDSRYITPNVHTVEHCHIYMVSGYSSLEI